MDNETKPKVEPVWPPAPIDVAEPSNVPGTPKPKVSVVVLVSITDTIGLFFVWGILSALLSGAWSAGHGGVALRYILDFVMPLGVGVAASYRWRRMGFRIGTHLLLLCVDIAVVSICSTTLLAGLMGFGGNPFARAAHLGPLIPADRIIAGLTAMSMVVVGALVGRYPIRAEGLWRGDREVRYMSLSNNAETSASSGRW